MLPSSEAMLVGPSFRVVGCQTSVGAVPISTGVGEVRKHPLGSVSAGAATCRPETVAKDIKIGGRRSLSRMSWSERDLVQSARRVLLLQEYEEPAQGGWEVPPLNLRLRICMGGVLPRT